jgi:hypothetical protein
MTWTMRVRSDSLDDDSLEVLQVLNKKRFAVRQTICQAGCIGKMCTVRHVYAYASIELPFYRLYFPVVQCTFRADAW